MKQKQTVFSLLQAAVIFGVHRNTVAKWISDGAPVVSRADRDRGVEWRVSIPDVMAWRMERAVADAIASLPSVGGKLAAREAARRRAVALATTAEIETADALRSLVLRVDADTAMLEFTGAIAEALATVGTAIALRSAAMSAPAAIHAVVMDEIDVAMRAAQAALGVKWAPYMSAA